MAIETDIMGKAIGGKARAERMTPAARSASASKAAAARWAQEGDVREVLAGSPDSPLIIGDAAIECYVLDDDTRVITQASMLRAIGRSARIPGAEGADESLPPILRAKSIRPYVQGVIDQAQPIAFRLPSGSRANGYRADLLPTICEIYLAARADKALPPNQLHIARQAEVLVRALAHVGIIALVDEATGYQDVRTKDALAQILTAFVARELQPWVMTFTPAYYREMFRLRGVPYDPSSVQRPQYFGALTNDIVYDRLAPGVKAELKAAQKKAEKSGRMFQHLTQSIGYPKLREHLGSVLTLMKLSEDWGEFKAKLDRIHPSYRNPKSPLWTDLSDFGL